MSRQLRLASSNPRQPAHNRSHLHKRILSRALSVRIVVRARCNSRAPLTLYAPTPPFHLRLEKYGSCAGVVVYVRERERESSRA